MQVHSELPRKFAELGIDIPFLRALRKLGFTQPSEIQHAMIPTALQGRDILGQARTGTGKTAAFGLPTLQRIDPSDGLQVICLAPTRELATQVVAEICRLSSGTDLHTVPVYGGQKIRTQLHALGRKPHFVVGTPGRVLDLLGRGALRFDNIEVCILDEVDRMLDIGFRDDIKRILERIRRPHQTIFVSATIDDEINRLARQFMNNPVEINVSRDELTVSEVEQIYCSVEQHDKYRLLRAMLAHEKPKSGIIFCRTKHGARKLTKKLRADGVSAMEIHGDLMQARREGVMAKFRTGKFRLLIATDLAARGLDISTISHIINFDIPEDPEVYIHRIGRTARMGASGKAITLVTPGQGKEITEIEKLINKLLKEEKYDGFVSGPSPAETRTSMEPQAVGAPTGSNSATAAPSRLPPPKTLGGKFRTRRSRRR